MMRAKRTCWIAGAVIGLAWSAAAVAGQTDLRTSYLALDLQAVVDSCSGDGAEELSAEAAFLRLRALARQGRADRAIPALATFLRNGDDRPSLLLTAAIVQHGAANLPAARRYLDRALAAPDVEAEAWLEDALLRLMERDAAGAARSYATALRLDPTLRGTVLAYTVGTRVGVATRDATLMAETHAARAEALERRGLDSSARRAQERLYRAVDGPLMAVDAAADEVSIPFVSCYDGSPYWCVALTVAGREYRVLLDTGNAPGFTVHHPELRDALITEWGAVASTSTGSVDSVMASRQFLVRSLDFGTFAVRNVSGTYFPKPRERYFDANLNPFMLNDRVVTLDVPGQRLVLRTPERFRAASVGDPTRTVRRPVLGYDRFYVNAMAGGKPALTMIETGAEHIGVGAAWATRSGVAVTDTIVQWRGKDYPARLATVAVRLGPIVLGPRESGVHDAFGHPPGGMAWDIMLGPGVLESLILSFDPFERELLLEDPGPGDDLGG